MQFDTQSKSDWSNYWQGRTHSKGGDVLEGVGIEHSAKLKNFWKNTFSHETASVILDLGCGAGSALKWADHLPSAHLIGIDISYAALCVAREKIKNLNVYVASADQLPFRDNSIDLIVSQFGFEYAGPDTASEIHRALKP